ncbi:MAG: ParA family protein [Bacteroidota bacterium]
MAKETRIISVANRKGGVGKSIVTILLAVALARHKKKRVLILDCDNQGSIAEMYQNEIDLMGEEYEPAIEVEEITARKVQTFLKRFGQDYDLIFVDIPRMTDNKKDNATVMLLYNCDSILMPVIGSEVDVLSSLDFLAIIEEAAEFKEEVGEKLTYYGFINRRNLRKTNDLAEEAMRKQGLKMFKNSLADLKIYTLPSFFTSVMETAEGLRRFEGFYKEFCRKFKL